jgi:Pectate lyase superfamily protein
MRVLIIILFPLFSFAQLNIKSFGARETYADNSRYIQRAIDSAVKSGKYVYIPIGRFNVTAPLVVSKFECNKYVAVSIKIIGESTFWDLQNRSVLVAKFTDAPLLSVQLGKGCTIQGITFVGQWKSPGSPYGKTIDEYIDPTTRDSKYSPYCGLAIDPFCYTLPDDGGYPSLTNYYKGELQYSGSTGIIIKDCFFTGFTIGAITSPNGFTQNGELISFENIQIQNCKIGIAGCQDQEKMNRITNLGCWGTTHTVFAFNTYGKGIPGNWVIDGVNIAGDVNQVLYRWSSGYFPLFMSNIYAENIFQFGYWQSSVGDAISNFVFDFTYPDQFGTPKAHFEGSGVTLNNGVVRVYGTSLPIIFTNGFALRDVVGFIKIK